MKKNLYILFLFFSIFSFGQIGDPTPDLDFEPSYQDNGKPGDKWDFSKKPYKKIKTIKANVVVDEFDSVGRYTSRSVFWNHFTDSTTKKYKDDMLVEFTWKKIYNRDEKESKTYQDEIKTTKLNVTNKGRIIDGEIFTLTKDSIYKVTGHQYYDKKNRLIKIAYSEELGEINFYYSGENLIRKEQIDIIDSKTKIVRDKTYKYNKDNQIVFHETVKSIFVNNTLTEKKNTYTVHQEFKDKLLVKKILKDESETIERNYTYDNNKNVITFIEIKKNNNDGMITSQIRRTKKYEDNLLVYSEVQEGLGTQEGKFSFSYYSYSNESLSKQSTTYEKGNIQTEYLYNEYDHLIKTITTYSNKTSRNEVVYEIEYY